MADENKVLIDSLNMEALGYGVFENAKDAASGQAALVDAYNSYNWSNPKAAQDTLEYYGEELRYKFKDSAPAPADSLFQNAPVSLLDMEPKTDADYENLFDNWVKANEEYLKTTDEPEFLVNRKKLLSDIKEAAVVTQRSIGAEAARDSAGQVGSSLIDINNRFLKGVAQVAEAPVRVLTGIDLNDRLTQVTDPDYDEDFGSALIEGAGSGVGTVGAYAFNPVTGTAAIVGMGVDAVAQRRKKALETTGDPSQANTAAAIEAGSQLLQVGAAGKVFGGIGRIAKKQPLFGRAAAAGAEHATIGGITKGAAFEATAEGSGQAISNIAENVGNDQDPLKDVGRGVGTAAVIGGVVAGGLGAAAYDGGPRTLTESNSGARTAETLEQGGPTTPVTKQTIGPLSAETVEEVFPDTEVTGEPTAERPAETNIEEAKAVPKEPRFVTEDGSTYLQAEDGTLSRQDIQGNLENPFDHTYFLTDETRQEVGKAIKGGGQVLVENGNPWVETVTDGKRILTPIENSKEPANGMWVMDASESRKPNKDTVERPVRFGRRVKEVYPQLVKENPKRDQSLGAYGTASPEDYEIKESTYGRKLQEGVNVAPEFAKLAKDSPLLYETFKLKDVDAELARMLEEQGIASLFDLYQSPLIQDQNVRNRIGVAVTNAANSELIKASEAGDVDKVFQLTEALKKFAPLRAAAGVASGQAQRALQGETALNSTKLTSVLDTAYQQEVAKQAEASGVDPIDIAESDKKAKDLEASIAATTAQIEIQKKAEIVKDTSTTEALDEAINEIESAAQSKLSEDLGSIEAESQDLRDRIQGTEEKARKNKNKDIDALTKAITIDSAELTKTILLGKNLAKATKEETDALNAEIASQIEEATKATNKLVKEAVKEERRSAEERKAAQKEALNNRLNSARTNLNRVRENAQKQILRYKLRERGFIAAGDLASAEIARTKVSEVENRVTNASDRVRAAEDALEKFNTKTEAELQAQKDTEEILNELDSGVEVKITPTPRGRKVSVTTRRSGQDISKLFRKGEATKPLIALSRGLAELSDVFRTSAKGRGENNKNLKALMNRIAENRQTLDRVKSRDVLSDSQKAAIAAAKKRLDTLSKAKKEATLESRMGKDAPKYKKYKEARANRKPAEKSERLQQLEEQLNFLNEQKRENVSNQEKKKAAQEKAAKAATEEAKRQQRIGQLREAIERNDLKGATKRAVEQEIYLLQAADEKSPLRRDTLYRLWVANNIGSVYGTLVAVGSSGIVAPFTKATGFVLGVPATFLKSVKNADTRYKYPLFEYLRGLANPEAFFRGVDRAIDTIRTGTRLENIIPTEELVANRSKIQTQNYQDTIGDFVQFVKTLPPATTPLEWVSRYAQVGSAYTAGMFLRLLSAAEAVTYSMHDHGFDRAAAAYYYNKGLDEKLSDAELQRYMYSPKENWARAQAVAATTAKELRDAGVPFSEAQERVLAAEKYQEMRPREVQVDVFKQAASVVLNAPAPGYAGILTYYLNKAADDVSFRGVRPLKYLTPFANSIAQLMQLNMETTPLGYITALSGTEANRTQFERHMAVSSATVGTALFAALAMKALNGLDDEDSWFDIIGMYSSDEGKRKAFQQSGGLLNSIRIGNVYIPFGETTMAMGLGAVAGFVDKVRNGEAASTDVFAATTTASFSGLDTLLMNINMLKGVSDLYDSVKTLNQDPQKAAISTARTLVNTMKGFVPGAGVIRNIARMYDYPIEVKKDLMSAIVEGVPVLQSAYGLKALNIFGEPMPPAGALPALHRIFSIKRDDVDIRWLTDNGYSIPGASTLRPTKAMGDVKLDYLAKHKILQAAGPQMRSVVAQYRRQFGNSAHSDEVQKALRKDINKVLAVHKTQVADEY